MPRIYAAVILTAVDRCPDGSRSGYWLPEAAYPWAALDGAGWDVRFISTHAAEPEPGGVDATDPLQRRFLQDERVRRRLADTRRAGAYRPQEFSVVVYAGGCGALRDLPEDAELAAFTGEVMRGGGVVAACGHGVAGLLAVTGPQGDPLVHGRRMTGPSPQEERFLAPGTTDPESDAGPSCGLADELKRRGARYSARAAFTPHVVTDGHLITGQNPASAPELASLLVGLSARAGLSPEGGTVRPPARTGCAAPPAPRGTAC